MVDGEKLMKVQSYKELNVWKKGMEIVDQVYGLTETFPSKEQYGLASQMQRAAVSIPTNIAEGFARHHTKEFVQFLHIALGSCAELETHLMISERRGYVAAARSNELQGELEHESRMLMALIKSLRKRIA
mgnify:CR=1 FL=1